MNISRRNSKPAARRTNTAPASRAPARQPQRRQPQQPPQRQPQRAAQHQRGRQQGAGGYQQMELTGALFHNDQPNGPDSPYYLGSVTVGGIKYWVSGWLNTAQSGKRYVGLKLRPVDEMQPAPSDAAPDDEVPF